MVWTGVTTTGTVSVSITGPGTVSNGQFSTYGLFSFSGRFDTPASASGTYSFSNYPLSHPILFPPYICNIHLGQNGLWTAYLP